MAQSFLEEKKSNLKGEVQPKMKIVIYLHSCHYKPFFCEKQDILKNVSLHFICLYNKKGSKVALVHT